MIEQRLPYWDNSSSAGLVKEFADTPANILLFNERMGRTQPSFFISRCSWDLLVNGISRRKDGSLIQWLPANHTVYGFVFCIAFNRKDAYFRIRTILKENGVAPERDDKGKMVLKVWIEGENIAYVDINTALSNIGSEESGRIKKDCLKFIYSRDTGAIDEVLTVNSQVYVKTRHEILPTSFKISPPQKKLVEALKNEGSLFGKVRLWNKLLNTIYPESKGTEIAIAVSETYDNTKYYLTRSMYFNFKINGDCDTNLPCPNPPICE